MARQLDVVGEKDWDGFVVASESALAGCHSQARSLEALMERIREAIALWLDVQEDELAELDVVGVQRVTGRHHLLAAGQQTPRVDRLPARQGELWVADRSTWLASAPFLHPGAAMNAERLLAHFETISETPDAVTRLRCRIRDLAQRGKLMLVEQEPEDEPVEELVEEWLKILSAASPKEDLKNQSQQTLQLVDNLMPLHMIAPLCPLAEFPRSDPNSLPLYVALRCHLWPPPACRMDCQTLALPSRSRSSCSQPKAPGSAGCHPLLKEKAQSCQAAKVDFVGLCSVELYSSQPLLGRAFLVGCMPSSLFVEQATAGDHRVALPKITQTALKQIRVQCAPSPQNTASSPGWMS